MAETEGGASTQTQPEPEQQKDQRALARKPEPSFELTQEGGFDIWRDAGTFNHLHRVATLFAGSEIVPKRYRGKPNDTMIVMAMAMRHNADPMMFLQGMYVVHGNPGMEAKLAIALANKAGVFKGAITYDFSGQDMGRMCVASAVDAKSGQTLKATCSMQMAKAEGWLGKEGSKWKTIPDLMLQYRSAMFLIRTHYPDVIYGMLSRDEAEEVAAREVEVETIDAQRQEIIDAVDNSLGGQPRLPQTTDPDVPEEPLEDLMDGAAEVVEDGQAPEEPEPEPEPEPEEPKVDMSKLRIKYIELCERVSEVTGQKQSTGAISSMSQEKLEARIAELTAKLKG